jgi:hypothetical protein
MWQKIETAPKDGTWIVAWDGKTVLPLCWVEGDPDYPSEYTGWAYGSEYWGGTLYDGANEVKHQPTHWMPLPASPTAEGE